MANKSFSINHLTINLQLDEHLKSGKLLFWRLQLGKVTEVSLTLKYIHGFIHGNTSITMEKIY